MSEPESGGPFPWIASWTALGVVASFVALGLSVTEYHEDEAEKRKPIFDIVCSQSKSTDAEYDILVGGHRGDRRQPVYAGARLYDNADNFRAESSRRCELTNDGQLPVQNARLLFRAVYFKAGSQDQLPDVGAPSLTLPIRVIAPGKPIDIEVTDIDSTDAYLDEPSLTFQRPEDKADEEYSFPGAGSVSIDLRASPLARGKNAQPTLP